MSYGRTELKVGDLTLLVEGTFEDKRAWVDVVYLIHRDQRIELTDLLEAIQKDCRSWYWADWAAERLAESSRQNGRDAA